MQNRNLPKSVIFTSDNQSVVMGEKQPDTLLCNLGKEESEVAVL